MSHSSGGRSAVQASRGTADRWASTTAPWKCVAAVPDVHSTTAGRPVARPRPSAVNEADRSSWTTWTRTSAGVGQGEGERRRPGARRDDGVGHAGAAPLVDERGAEGGGGGHGHQANHTVLPYWGILGLVTLASRTIGSGPRLVLLHGFTQNSACWGPFADRLAARPRGGAARRPGSRRLAPRRRRSRRSGPAQRRGGRRRDLPRLLDGWPRCPARRGGRTRPGPGAGADRRHRGDRGRDRARAPAAGPTRPWPPARRPGLEGFLDRWLAQPLFATLPTGGRNTAPHGSATDPRAWPPACATAGPAPNGRCGTTWPA